LNELIVSAEDSNLSNHLDKLEALAWLDMYRAAPAEFSRQVGMAWTDSHGESGFAMRAVSSSLFNRVILSCPKENLLRATLINALAWLKANGSKNVILDSSVACLQMFDDLCREIGLRMRQDGMAKFWCSEIKSVSANTNGLEVRAVGEEAGEVFGKLIQESYGLPPHFSTWLGSIPGRPNWLTYLVYDANLPIAGAAMYLVGESAWLGVAATKPQHRNRGAQSALIARRLADGLDLRTKIFAVDTGVSFNVDGPGPSFRNIERAGFMLSHVRRAFELDENVASL